jgi:hypothetical protein
LKESFNYGLFCPPSNGKAGKFLDEERRLGDYPFNGPVGYLEVSFCVKQLEDNFSLLLNNILISLIVEDEEIETKLKLVEDWMSGS